MTACLAPPRAATPDAVLVRLALALGAVLLALAVAALLDGRRLDGEDVWLKPAKFAASLGLYAATLAWGARWLPADLTRRRWFRAYVLIVAGCILAEMVWIASAAGLGLRSHYNDAQPFLIVLYPFMGALAVTLTTAAGVWAWGILRTARAALPRAFGWGAAATCALTIPIAGTLSGFPGGLTGAPSGDPLPLVGWYLTDDLRPAHFLATHAIQVVPLAVLAWRGAPAWAGAALALPYAAATLAAFAWAFV